MNVLIYFITYTITETGFAIEVLVTYFACNYRFINIAFSFYFYTLCTYYL